MIVNPPIKNKAELKSPSCTKKPITDGTITADKPPIKLKTPPTKPMILFGAISETKIQVIDANPFPKKAIVKNRMMKNVLSVKFAPIIKVDKDKPINTGTFLANSGDFPFLIK